MDLMNVCNLANNFLEASVTCPLPGVLKESRMQWPYSCKSDCHQQRALLQQTAATFEDAHGLSIINNSFFPPSQFHSLPLEQWP